MCTSAVRTAAAAVPRSTQVWIWTDTDVWVRTADRRPTRTADGVPLFLLSDCSYHTRTPGTAWTLWCAMMWWWWWWVDENEDLVSCVSPTERDELSFERENQNQNCLLCSCCCSMTRTSLQTDPGSRIYMLAVSSRQGQWSTLFPRRRLRVTGPKSVHTPRTICGGRTEVCKQLFLQKRTTNMSLNISTVYI